MRFIVLLLTGCIGQSYNSTKVGHDRYVITSHGHEHGAENHAFILQKAYDTCIADGYKDYTVNEVVHEVRKVVVFVKCEQEPIKNTPAQEETKHSTLMDDLEKFYNDTKKKLQN